MSTIERDETQIDHERQPFRIERSRWLTAQLVHKTIDLYSLGKPQPHHQNFDQPFIRRNGDL